MLHRRNSNSAGEHVEAEQAARAARASKEKSDRLEAAREKQQQQQNVGPHIEWGRGGVSAAFSEEVEVNGEASPENRRNTPSKSKGHVEVGGHAKAPPPRSLGWGPDSTHVAPTSPSLEATPAVAPYPIGEELTQSVQFLSEALKSERKRSDELEARRLQLEEANAALRAELRAAQDKAFQAMFPTASLT